jgi:hypothetical protein
VMRLNAPDRATALAISARIFTGTACRCMTACATAGCSDATVVSIMPHAFFFVKVAEKRLKNQASYRPSAGITRIRFKGSMAREAILSARFIPAPR